MMIQRVTASFIIVITSCGSTKSRYKVLIGALKLWMRDICCQVCRKNGGKILRRGLEGSRPHVRFGSPEVGDERSCAQDERPFIIQDLMGICAHTKALWGWGFFSTTCGAMTEGIVLQYLASHSNPTGASGSCLVSLKNLLSQISRVCHA